MESYIFHEEFMNGSKGEAQTAIKPHLFTKVKALSCGQSCSYQL